MLLPLLKLATALAAVISAGRLALLFFVSSFFMVEAIAKRISVCVLIIHQNEAEAKGNRQCLALNSSVQC